MTTFVTAGIMGYYTICNIITLFFSCNIIYRSYTYIFYFNYPFGMYSAQIFIVFVYMILSKH
nr:MAG TPA: hypothetical protein [Caudoviricetes sp.]